MKTTTKITTFDNSSDISEVNISETEDGKTTVWESCLSSTRTNLKVAFKNSEEDTRANFSIISDCLVIELGDSSIPVTKEMIPQLQLLFGTLLDD